MTGPRTGPGPERRMLNKGLGPDGEMEEEREVRGVTREIMTVGRGGGADWGYREPLALGMAGKGGGGGEGPLVKGGGGGGPLVNVGGGGGPLVKVGGEDPWLLFLSVTSLSKWNPQPD